MRRPHLRPSQGPKGACTPNTASTGTQATLPAKMEGVEKEDRVMLLEEAPHLFLKFALRTDRLAQAKR